MNEKMGMTPAALMAMLAGDTENAIAAMTPGGIEAQEAAGQQSFVANETLPKENMHGCTREKLESMGIIFGEDADDLFVAVKLPSGWKKQATSHSMWSDLLDDKGRIRAKIFYKAAFYDRSSHISLCRRYNVQVSPEDRYEKNLSYEERTAGKWAGIVTECDKEVFCTDWIVLPQGMDERRATEQELRDKAEAWVVAGYPEWHDETKYWG